MLIVYSIALRWTATLLAWVALAWKEQAEMEQSKLETWAQTKWAMDLLKAKR